MAKQVQDGKTEATRVFRVRHLFYLLGAILFALAVFSYEAQDLAVRARGMNGVILNWIGVCGAVVAGSLFFFVGLTTYVLAVMALLAAVRPFLSQRLHRQWFWPGVFFSVIGITLLLALDPGSFSPLCADLGLGRMEKPELAISGGVIGQILAAPPYGDLPAGVLRMLIGTVGTALVGSILLLAGLIMLYFSEWHSVVRALADTLCTDNAYKMQKTIETPEEEVPEPPAEKKVSFMEKARQLLPHRAAAVPEAPTAPEQLPQTAPMMQNESQTYADIPEQPPTPEAAMVAPEPAATGVPTAPPPQVQPQAAPQAAVRNDMASATALPPAAKANTVQSSVITGELSKPKLEAGSSAPRARREYTLPPITMLGKGQEIAGETPEAIARNKEILQNTLDSFRIDGQVVGHISGPRVTRYEIRLAPSVKVSKVTEIEDNIAMNLRAKSVRILAPIPERDVVGVEVPNTKAEAVTMRSVLESDVWLKSSADIPLVLGKDVSGKPVVLDLGKAPHLLIAGATGTGKSVCMNTLIMSLLMTFSPDDLRLIMVDPKVVEMASYQNLPHLITPVIDDFKKVPVALRWAATEMDKRYKLLAKARVRKLKEYNSRTLPETPVLDDDGIPLPDRLPILIIIIDELADLMSTDARNDIETSIQRITAKGRAAGVHIVLATQRPSRDVITGTIKGNLPTRIALRVISNVDSRVILDQKGAEGLLGQGDMMLLAPGGTELERIQGAWVADGDIEKVVDFVSAQAPQNFDQEVITEPEAEEEDGVQNSRSGKKGGTRTASSGDDWSEEDADNFIDNGFELDPIVQKYLRPGDSEQMRKALEIILLEKKASTSYLQRRLKIGYNNAAELIDAMEERGIVGPPSGSGSKREILVFDDVIPDQNGMQ